MLTNYSLQLSMLLQVIQLDEHHWSLLHNQDGIIKMQHNMAQTQTAFKSSQERQ